MGKNKIKEDGYSGKESATHPLPTFRQSVSGCLVDLLNEMEKHIAVVRLNVLLCK